MTEKGQEYYEAEVCELLQEVFLNKENIEKRFIEAENAQRENDFELLWELKDKIEGDLDTYLSVSRTFVDYLKRCATHESSLELSSHIMISDDLANRVNDTVNSFKFIKTEHVEVIDDVHVSSKTEEASVCSGRSRHSRSSSRCSTSSSVLLAKSKAKAEGARTRLQFAEREFQLKLKQAECVADLELLTHKKELAVAEAELSVVQEEIGEQRLSKIVTSLTVTEEKIIPTEPSHTILDENQQSFSGNHIPPGHVNHETGRSRSLDRDLSFNVNAPEFVPVRQHPMPTQASDLTSYLLKRDLLNLRLTKFSDNPAEYQMWKTGFRNIGSELNLSPSEEMELLVRWLGVESGRYASSITIVQPS
ncbi:LOW QUALITY PROTEIN: uncharacterized protein LOC124276870 [Haliotis rubra]|uniref:LOW QUALITY PROTEIN: uncharacterized protein LOC124276870 n=1 Tax=Haliotis rubra TaxID=36100 RepID=UPI001EE50688|nr:LOW QUALITY PROTEIN: uncharacterized protein LOC124276870 [Haliotis rubra]